MPGEEPLQKAEKKKNYKERVLSGEAKPWWMKKQTSLKRSSTLKRNTQKLLSRSPLRSTKRLKSVSRKQRSRLKKYNELKKEFRQLTESKTCSRCGGNEDQKGMMDMHHPKGRGGDYMYEFIPMCRECHDWIHKNPSQALKDGWLQPEYRNYAQ